MAKITSSARIAYEVINEITGVNQLRTFKDSEEPNGSSRYNRSFVLPFYMFSNDEMCDSECENCAKIFGKLQQDDGRSTPSNSVEIGFSETFSNSASEHNFDGTDSNKNSDNLDHLSTASDVDITWNNIFDNYLEIGKEEICNIKHASDTPKVELHESLVQCSHCDFSCLEHNDLIIHSKAVHANLSQFDCFACEEQFTIYKEMINHLESVHQKNDMILCKICNIWVNCQFICSHFKTCKASKPYRCKYCVKYFETYEHKENHQAEHNKECPYCESSFFFQSDYRKHVRTAHHKEVIEDFINFVDCELEEYVMGTSPYNIKVRFMELLTSPPNEYRENASEDKDIEELLNQICKDVKHQSNKIVHVPLSTIREVLKLIQKYCPRCYRKFVTHKLLEQHCKPRHHLSQPYECYSCADRFTTANQRTHHLYTEHNSIYNILCKFCNKYVKTEYKMSRHIVYCFKHLKKSKTCNANKGKKFKGTNKGTPFYIKSRRIKRGPLSEKNRYSSFTSDGNLRHSEQLHEGTKKIKNKLKEVRKKINESRKEIFEQQPKSAVIDSEEQVNIEQVDKLSPLLVPMQNLDNVSPSNASSSESEAANTPSEQMEKSAITEQNIQEEFASILQKSPDHNMSPVNNQNKNVLCSFCSKSFHSKYDMLEHLNEAHKKIETIVCKLCGDSVSSDINIVNHLVECISTHQKEDEENSCVKRECSLCNRFFNNYTDLLEHIKNSHGIYVCYTCDARFYTTEKRRLHLIEKHDGLNKIMCKLCRRPKTSEIKIREHLDACKDKPYQCRYCYARFFNSSFYLAHSEKHKHFGLQQSVTPTSDVSNMEYSRESTSPQSVNMLYKSPSKDLPSSVNHTEGHHTALLKHCKTKCFPPCPYVCYTCDQQFEDSLNRLCHIQQKHYMPNGFVCKMCGTIEEEEQGIKLHMLLCAKKPHHCKCCSFRFYTQIELDQHNDEVITKPNQCQCCPSRFATYDELKVHEIIHMRPLDEMAVEFELKEEPTEILAGEDSSTYDLLGLRSFDAVWLSQIKTKWCPDCYKVFFKFRNLKLHCKQEHNNSDLFGCFCCSARFNKREEQVHHLQTVHATGKYPCKFCDIQLEAAKLFEHIMLCKKQHARQNKLSEDNNLLTVEIFRCSYCQEEFKNWRSLDLHEVVNHGKNCENEEAAACRPNDARVFDVSSVQENSLERPHSVTPAVPMESDDVCSNRFSQSECDSDNGSNGMDVDVEHSEEDQQAQDLFTDTCSLTDGNISSKTARNPLQRIRFGCKEWVVILHDFIKSSTLEDTIDDDIDSHSVDVNISNTQLPDNGSQPLILESMDEGEEIQREDSHNVDVNISNTQLPDNDSQPPILESIDEDGEFTEPITCNGTSELLNFQDGSDHDSICDASTTNMDSDSSDSQLPLSYIKAKLITKPSTSNSKDSENGNAMDCDKTNTDTPLDVSPLNVVSAPNFEFKNLEKQGDEFINEEPIAENEKLDLNLLVSNIISRLEEEADAVDDNSMDVQISPATLIDKDVNGPNYNMASDPLFIEEVNTSFSLEAAMPKEKRSSPDKYLDECWVVLHDFMKGDYSMED